MLGSSVSLPLYISVCNYGPSCLGEGSGLENIVTHIGNDGKCTYVCGVV
jgi:hypothetical protein